MRSASIIAVALAVLAAAPVARAEDAAAVTGTWVTPEGRSRIAITESDGKYCGKIVWLKEYNYSEDEEDADTPQKRSRERRSRSDDDDDHARPRPTKALKVKLDDPTKAECTSCAGLVEADALICTH